MQAAKAPCLFEFSLFDPAAAHDRACTLDGASDVRGATDAPTDRVPRATRCTQRRGHRQVDVAAGNVPCLHNTDTDVVNQSLQRGRPRWHECGRVPKTATRPDYGSNS